MLRKRWLICTLASAVFLLFATSCKKTPERDRLRIVATVFPLAEFAENIVGPHGEVRLLLPPGAEAHSWKPRPSDMLGLARTDLIIFIGGGMEPWLEDMLSSMDNAGLQKMEASQGLFLLRGEGHQHEGSDTGHRHGEKEEATQEETAAAEFRPAEEEGAFDPHIWLDFGNDQLIIQNLVKVLSQLEPEHRDYFQSRADSYIAKVQALDESYRSSLQRCQGRTLILGGHAAFGYLAHRYKLEQIALFGLNPEARPSARQLKEVVDLAKEQGIKAVFFDELINADLAGVLADEVSAQALVLNPGANLTREQRSLGVTFLDLMRKNLDNLKTGLGCV